MTSAVKQASCAADAQKQARIDALKARYEALRAEGQAAGNFEAAINAAPRIAREIPAKLVQTSATVPAGWYWYGRVARGACLRLGNAQGTPGVACLIWNAVDPTERFYTCDTIKVQWTARIGRGRVLLSDMGRVLAAIVEDNCERHDVLLGVGMPRADDGSSPLISRNGTENLGIVTAKLGLEMRDMHPPLTFFAPVRCRDQHFAWDSSVSLSGTYVDLYAEMDLLVGLSNVPHPMAPMKATAQPIKIEVWRPEKPGVSNFCREATAEAERAYARTQSYLAELYVDGNGSR